MSGGILAPWISTRQAMQFSGIRWGIRGAIAHPVLLPQTKMPQMAWTSVGNHKAAGFAH